MKILGFISIVLLFAACAPQRPNLATNMPIGHFVDDYKIEYTISDSLFFQLPSNRYHILSWHDGYIIARNDSANSSEPGLYSRIDFTRLKDMPPFQWAFCYTNYAADSDSTALATIAADTNSLRTGCNGFPFSRLRPKK